MLKKFYYQQEKEFFSYISVNRKQNRNITKTVDKIISSVIKQGDQALLKYTRKFDKIKQNRDALKVKTAAFQGLKVASDFRKAVQVAYKNIYDFHINQQSCSFTHTGQYGEKLTQKTSPVNRAGIYVPAGSRGQTPLISSLLMNAVPAMIAGVKEIIIATPPAPEGLPAPALLYAADFLKLHDIFQIGGAQAVAAMAYGTETVPPVDIIAGPGNIFVTCAKKAVLGDVMIDGIFGQSEIVIIADGSVPADWAAADLISQAEHAGGELAVLITSDPAYADKVINEIKKQAASASRKNIISASLKDRGGVMITENIEQAVAVSNQIAPEHLELQLKNYESVLPLIENAGAVFTGPYGAEPIGDYICGTNHVLPTNGSARFSSPLGVYNFMKRTNIIKYNKKAFTNYSKYAAVLAETEGLTG
ncbi:MAG TPA: histidinol dehydrogenase, partial [Spirochaetota bacterium]|nr:histidinol dehydrogenase [Spirochaetota bacterium]